MPSSSAYALLFDLGRVVIDIDFNRAFSRWAGHARCDQKLIRERFRHHDTAYKRHELRSARRSSLTIFEHPSRLIFRTRNCLTGGTPSLSERCPASLNCWPRRREASRLRLYQFQPRTRTVLVKAVFRHSRQFQRGLRVVDDWVEKARSRGVRLCCQGNRRVGRPYCVL